MPKIVDHDSYRAELVARAMPVFRELGYHGLSMRRIASQLGVSKSSLYHYFPSKKALFDACSERATGFPIAELPADAPPAERYEALVEFAELLEQEFRGEVTLLLDYVRPMSPQDVRSSESLEGALTAFRSAIAAIVGRESADAALAQVFGLLLIRIFDGGATGFDTLRCLFPAKSSLGD
ncbi:MAG: AcrR family transcriptional regulator [Bradymonadia bacterium]|jgi:AcrR family transcriptional regulator